MSTKRKISSGARPGNGSAKISSGSDLSSGPQARNTDSETVVLRFQYVDEGEFGIHTLDSEDLQALTRCFKRLEQTTWYQVKTSGGRDGKDKTGFGFTPLTPNKNLPDGVSKDVDVSEMRFGRKKRVWGFRQQQYYFLLWYDPEHKISEK